LQIAPVPVGNEADQDQQDESLHERGIKTF
jgi:hypothetical protein